MVKASGSTLIDLPNLKRELRDRTLGLRLSLSGRPHHFREVVTLRTLVQRFDVDCVFDVGANVGQYGSMMRRDVGYTGTILSFEPGREAFGKLKVAAHSDNNWHAFDYALSDIDGKSEFHDTAGSQFASLHRPIVHDPAFAGKSVVAATSQVTTKRLAGSLDHFINDYTFERPFLKLDTQGHDLAVIKGAGTDIQKFVAIQTELNITPIYEGACHYIETIGQIEALGFRLADILSNNRGHFPKLYDADAIFVRKDLIVD